MSLDKSEDQHLTLYEKIEIIHSFFASKDEEDEESQDEDEDEDNSTDEEDEEDDDEKDRGIVSKAADRHIRKTDNRSNGGYSRPPAAAKNHVQPKQLSKSSQIIINGLRDNDSKETIMQQLWDTYTAGGNLEEAFCSENSHGVTALSIAVLTNNWEVAKCLLEILFLVFHQDYSKFYTYTNKVDMEGNTIVHEMAYMGDKIINTLGKLLNLRISDVSNSQSQNPIFDAHKLNKEGEHPLHFCIKSPRFCTEAIQVFYNVDPNILNVTDRKKNTLLHYFLLCLPKYCSTFDSVKEQAAAVKKAMEFLLSFDATRDCLLMCNSNNKTPESLLGEIKNISRPTWLAANEVLKKQPRPLLLQIALDQPSTVHESSPPAIHVPVIQNQQYHTLDVQNQPSTIPDMQNEPSPLPDVYYLLSSEPSMQYQLSPMPAIQNQPSPTPAIQNQPSPTPAIQNQLSPLPPTQNQLSPMPAMQNQLSPMPAMQNQLSPMPAMQNQLSPMPAMQYQLSPVTPVQNQLSPMPAMQNQLSPMPAMQYQLSSMPVIQNQPSPTPATYNHPSPTSVRQNQSSPVSHLQNDGVLNSTVSSNHQTDLLDDTDLEDISPETISNFMSSLGLDKPPQQMSPKDVADIPPQFLSDFGLDDEQLSPQVPIDGKSLTSETYAVYLKPVSN